MARQNFYTNATAIATTTATTDQTALTLSFTPDDNSDYVLLWAAGVRNVSNITTDTIIKLTDNASATLCSLNMESKDTTNWIPAFGQAKATFATATGTYSFSLKYAQETATGARSNIRDAALIAIKLATTDYFTGNSTEVTTTSTATSGLTTATSLAFTPSATGNYLLIGTAEFKPDQNGAPLGYIKFSAAGTGTDYSSYPLTAQDPSNYVPFGSVIRMPLTASEWVYSILFGVASAVDIVNCRNPRITALRMDGFASDAYTDDRTLSTISGTATGFQTKLTLTFTPNAASYLIIGGNVKGVANSNTTDGISELTEDGTSVTSFNIEVPNSGGNWGTSSWSEIFLYRKTLAAVSTSWVINYAKETSADYRVTSDEAFISVIQLSGGGTTTQQSFSITASGIAAIIRSPQLTFATKAVGVALVTKQILKSFSTNVVGVATSIVAKTSFQTLAAIAVGVVSMTKGTVLARTFSAIAVGIAAMTKAHTFQKAGSVLAVGVVSMTKLSTYQVLLAATLAGVTKVTLLVSKTLAAIAVGVVAMSKIFITIINVAAAATSSSIAAVSLIVSLARSTASVGLAAMTKGQVFIRTFAAISVGVAAMSEFAMEYRKKFLGEAGLWRYGHIKKHWKRRKPGWKPRKASSQVGSKERNGLG